MSHGSEPDAGPAGDGGRVVEERKRGTVPFPKELPSLTEEDRARHMANYMSPDPCPWCGQESRLHTLSGMINCEAWKKQEQDDD